VADPEEGLNSMELPSLLSDTQNMSSEMWDEFLNIIQINYMKKILLILLPSCRLYFASLLTKLQLPNDTRGSADHSLLAGIVWRVSSICRALL
jgi:hypothetical protein